MAENCAQRFVQHSDIGFAANGIFKLALRSGMLPSLVEQTDTCRINGLECAARDI